MVELDESVAYRVRLKALPSSETPVKHRFQLNASFIWPVASCAAAITLAIFYQWSQIAMVES